MEITDDFSKDRLAKKFSFFVDVDHRSRVCGNRGRVDILSFAAGGEQGRQRAGNRRPRFRQDSWPGDRWRRSARSGSLSGREARFCGQLWREGPGSSLSVIDIAAWKEVRRVEIGPASRPHGLLMAGGKQYFTAQGFKLIGRYDPASNLIDWLMGTALNRTHMIVVTKDLKEFFTSNSGSDTITAIERAGGSARLGRGRTGSRSRQTARPFTLPTACSNR
jgi:hypothetical protein